MTSAPAAAGIGHNRPPIDEPTPFDLAVKKIDDVFGEAALWLDGGHVQEQQIADGIGNLLTLIRDAKAFAEEHKEGEYRPHKTAADAVVEKYKPLLKKADQAAAACKAALAPWLAKVAAEIEATAKKAREEAEAKRLAAQEALRASDAANLAERAAAEALVKDAKQADKAANRAEKLTATAGGALGKAIGMRSVYKAVLTDAVAAARWYWSAQREDMLAFLQGQADRDVRLGKHAPDAIPGFRIDETKAPV